MQVKTISKILKNKLEDWLSTITDELLRNDVKKNILVSWWSITSMFLNEDINDFDIYINDMGVLKDLVLYYTKPYNIEVLDWRFDRIIDNDIDCIDAIVRRTLKENQIKLNLVSLKVNEKATEEELKKYIPLFFSPNAISLSNKIQIVCRFHWDNVQIHKTFDFIHATNYFTFEEWLVTNKEALESILTKQLKYQGSLYPLTTIVRIKKFLKRGWNISALEMLKVMFQISELDLKNPDVLEEQLIWVDVAYFSKLIEILRNTSELDSHYLNTIIDRVFNKEE